MNFLTDKEINAASPLELREYAFTLGLAPANTRRGENLGAFILSASVPMAQRQLWKLWKPDEHIDQARRLLDELRTWNFYYQYTWFSFSLDEETTEAVFLWQNDSKMLVQEEQRGAITIITPQARFYKQFSVATEAYILLLTCCLAVSSHRLHIRRNTK
jgi:hypothetical protein